MCDQIVGRSENIQRLLDLVRTVAPSGSTVLLQGESGTGKELITRAIHDASPRRDHRLAVVNCSALTESLLESELFGHEKGAFTGAHRTRPGRFELADGSLIAVDHSNPRVLRQRGSRVGVVLDPQAITLRPFGAETEQSFGPSDIY